MQKITIRKILKKTEEGIKVSLTPGGFFEELGIRYICPIDGHNINDMIKIFESIKSNSSIYSIIGLISVEASIKAACFVSSHQIT